MYHIGFCVSEEYFKFAAVTITSIVKNTNKAISYKNKFNHEIIKNQKDAEEKYCFHLLTSCTKQEIFEKTQILEQELNTFFPTTITIHTIDDTLFKDFPSWRGSYATYYKVIFPSVISKDIYHFLYLDADTFIQGDLRPIFLEPLENKSIAAAPSYRPSCMELQKDRVKALDSKNNDYSFFPHKCYICAGVIMYNMQKWNQEFVQSRFIEFLNTYLPNYADQDAINYALGNDIKILDFKWNMYFDYDVRKFIIDGNQKLRKLGYEMHDDFNIIIRHFMTKPWHTLGLHFSNSKLIFMEEVADWWKMAEQTPAFNTELLAIQKSETFQNRLRSLEKRKKKYQSYTFFYKLFSIYKFYLTKILYFINSKR